MGSSAVGFDVTPNDIQKRRLSVPKIISARSGGAVPTEPVWRRRSRIARRLVTAAHPCPNPGACACYCNRANTMSAPAANAVRQRSEHDPGSRAGACRSGAQHRGSARATSVRSGGPVSHGNASTICCASHSAVGCRVTANQSSCRRPWPMMRNANRHSNVRVRTTQRSIAAMASAWLRRNVRQVCDGGPRCRIMYLETVDSAISNPS